MTLLHTTCQWRAWCLPPHVRCVMHAICQYLRSCSCAQTVWRVARPYFFWIMSSCRLHAAGWGTWSLTGVWACRAGGGASGGGHPQQAGARCEILPLSQYGPHVSDPVPSVATSQALQRCLVMTPACSQPNDAHARYWRLLQGPCV